MAITKVFRLFGGKLGLRLFLVVFVSIVVIETVILLPSYLGHRRDLENRLEHVGRTIVVMALQPRGHADDADLLNHARMAARYSELAGGTLYRPDGSLIGNFGEPPELSPSDAGERPVFTAMTADGKRLEVVWSAAVLELPVTVVGRLDAEWIAPEMNAFNWRIAELALLITAFVGGVVLVIFNRMVLRRIVLLRQKMVATREIREAAALNIPPRPRDELDELAKHFNDLIARHTQDIAEQKLAREALAASERQYRDLYDIAPDMYCSVDAKTGCVIRCNQTLATTLGMRMDEIIGQPIIELYHPDSRKKAQDGLREFLETGKIYRDDMQLGRRDGGRIDVSLRVRAVRGEDGEILYSNLVWRDIGKRQRVEATLSESESALAKAQEIANIGNWRWSITDDRLISFSEQFAKIYGVSLGDDPAQASILIKQAVHPGDRDRSTAVINKAVHEGGGFSVDYRILLPNGDIRHVIEVGQVVSGESGIDRIGTLQDITERKRAEEETKLSQARLAGILDIAPEAVITIAGDMSITMFNQAAERIFGYAAEEVMGRPFDMLMPAHFRAGHGALVESFAQSSESARYMDQRGYIFGLRKDGSEFPAAASVSKLTIGQERLYTVMLRDTTAQRKIQDELIAAKNEAEVANQTKSEFLAAMSHELRTPLNVILGFSDIMRNQYLGPLGADQYVEYVEDIHKSGDHLLSLLSDLLDISSIEAGKMAITRVAVAVEEIVMDCLRIVAEQARGKGVELVHAIAEPMPDLLADRRSIKQILLNLLTNAIKFTPEGGSISLTAAASGGYLIFTVADNGVGIAPDKLPLVTDPFTRVEKDPLIADDGWGLGLAITKSLVGLHQGDMQIESEVGVGTTVTVTLPLA